MPASPCSPFAPILDDPQQPIVTPSVLKKIRGATDIIIPNYNETQVDFLSGEMPKSAVPLRSDLQKRDKICDTILDAIGNTPLVRLDRFAKKYGVKCQLLGKCEFLSAGGSIKDRIAYQMIQEAEDSGLLTPGCTIVEATSGNTGVGLCLVGAVKGYRVVIALPEKMSTEKLNTMRSLGAEIVRTPTEASWNELESHIGFAHQMQSTVPDTYFLDQYSNPANPRAHYLSTAEEILYQCDDNVSMVVVGAGTGGTMTGVAAKLKMRCPSCVIVGADPHGSILAEPAELNTSAANRGSYLVEGIGYDFIPPTCQRKYVDKWVKVGDDEAFRLAREMIRLEGLLIGGSSGTAIAAALQASKDLGPDDRCVIIFPDSSRNYMSKYMSDEWMTDHGFFPTPPVPVYGTRTVGSVALKDPITAVDTMSCKDALRIMDENAIDQLPVTSSKTAGVVGIVSLASLSTGILSGRATLHDAVGSRMSKQFKTVSPTTSIAEAALAVTMNNVVIVMNEQEKLLGVLTAIDLLKLVD